MKNFVKIYFSFGLVFLLLLSGCNKQKIQDGQKLKIQDAINEFIQTKLLANNGQYDINGKKTDFFSLHKRVKEKDGYFVSCADFKYKSAVYDVDYYVKNIDGKYVIKKEIFHKKNEEKVNKVLWQDNDLKDKKYE